MYVVYVALVRKILKIWKCELWIAYIHVILNLSLVGGRGDGAGDAAAGNSFL